MDMGWAYTAKYAQAMYKRSVHMFKAVATDMGMGCAYSAKYFR